MIISASRRTDIPCYYSDWFFNRLQAGFAIVQNPSVPQQYSRIKLNPSTVDGFVFWTKYPGPMLNRLDELKKYPYYFQFTVTYYDKTIEPRLPVNKKEIIRTFKELSDKIGPERIIWRYDPILLTEEIDIGGHIIGFNNIAKCLAKSTKKVIISFVDYQNKIEPNFKANEQKPLEISMEQQEQIAKTLQNIAWNYDMELETCAERMNPQAEIPAAHCVDSQLFEKMLKTPLKIEKDKNQRSECGCLQSVDIGAYNTCKNGCLYCYASKADSPAPKNPNHDPNSPIITGESVPESQITDRVIASCKVAQLQLDL